MEVLGTMEIMQHYQPPGLVISSPALAGLLRPIRSHCIIQNTEGTSYQILLQLGHGVLSFISRYEANIKVASRISTSTMPTQSNMYDNDFIFESCVPVPCRISMSSNSNLWRERKFKIDTKTEYLIRGHFLVWNSPKDSDPHQ